MTDTQQTNVEDAMREIHEDVSVIARSKPEMLPVLIGVIKGISLSSETSKGIA